MYINQTQLGVQQTADAQTIGSILTTIHEIIEKLGGGVSHLQTQVVKVVGSLPEQVQNPKPTQPANDCVLTHLKDIEHKLMNIGSRLSEETYRLESILG